MITADPEFVKVDPCLGCTLPICDDTSAQCKFVQIVRAMPVGKQKDMPHKLRVDWSKIDVTELKVEVVAKESRKSWASKPNGQGWSEWMTEDQRRAWKRAAEIRRLQRDQAARRTPEHRKRVQKRRSARKIRLADKTKRAILSVLIRLGEKE